MRDTRRTTFRRAAWALMALAAALAFVGRARTYWRLDPQLRAPLLRFRVPSMTPGIVRVLRRRERPLPPPTGVSFEVRHVPVGGDAPPVRVGLYRPLGGQRNTAALLWIHGGGYVMGSADGYHAEGERYASELGLLVVNVDYRLAPETPFPGPLEDCYAALRWTALHATELGIDPGRIAVAGDSAGGGLAAALVQLAHDRAEVTPAFQLLLYPMLDDRTTFRPDHAGRGEYVWSPGSNRMGWTAYLGRAPQESHAPEYAAPARREDLRGLAPGWIGVGTLDLFFPEDREYARRLNAAGVPCELHEVPGGYHASERFAPDAAVSRAFIASGTAALKRGLKLD